ncbi:MAG: hypothetical protein ACXVB8_13940 [Bdellovibrionota bacterium]
MAWRVPFPLLFTNVAYAFLCIVNFQARRANLIGDATAREQMMFLSMGHWGVAYLAVFLPREAGLKAAFAAAPLSIPFWNSLYQSLPVLRGKSDFERLQAPPSDLVRNQFSAVKYILIVLALFLFHKYLLNPYLMGETAGPHISPDFQHRPFFKLIAEHFSGIVLWWLVGTATLLQHLLFAAIYMGIVVCTARMAGYYVFQNTYRPWQAKTYADFYKRCSYFLGRLYIELYYRQLAPLFSRTGHVMFRRIIPLLLSITIAGWLHRITVIAATGEFLDILQIARMQAYILKYFFCIGVLFAIPSIFPASEFWKKMWPLRLIVYILSQGLIFNLAFP